ncbi:MAG: hypothetical protein IT536_05155 [Hyphomicrobiales bacterium]|nr:hypothetical protein [Hyphomicrobiales bacterium]
MMATAAPQAWMHMADTMMVVVVMMAMAVAVVDVMAVDAMRSMDAMGQMAAMNVSVAAAMTADPGTATAVRTRLGAGRNERCKTDDRGCNERDEYRTFEHGREPFER